ncbi:G patch domain-containing protein 11-like [Macrosteles quadrilineatus]|uniref:G patch domain-containing protein 11-like n=1 Tax=Macrosteles quadrilineatus TaxID=74068 RepID=UPI0023E10B7E|nr:G patch domain-containing protein 11-like [Macrosteles quadrilineatus]
MKMGSSDEEVDYMSDAFLQSICGKEDIRPGLIKSHAQKYAHKREANKSECDEKNRIRNPSLKEKESSHRESGLSKPIDPENKGFKMLQKLGFKPGSGLGKSGEGRVEPVSVEVKADRQGLGRKSSLEEIARLRAKYRAEAKEKLLNINDYRSRKAEEAAERKASLDLFKSQRVCWELDTKESIEEPAELWFWPANKVPKVLEEDLEEEKEDEDAEVDQQTSSTNEDETMDHSSPEEDSDVACEDDTFSVQEKLEMLTLYLRQTYLYCVWCGHTFEDERDLQQDCPGPLREDH